MSSHLPRPRAQRGRARLSFTAVFATAALAAALVAGPAQAGPSSPDRLAGARQATSAAPTTGFVTGDFVPTRVSTPAFRPAVDAATYAAMKAAAARASTAGKPGAPAPLAPPATIGQNFAGTDQVTACACLPPDTHGTVGLSNYIQIVNSRVVIYNKAAPNAIVQQASLNSFFNYTGPESTLLFDPRAIYDPAWKRYVLSAEGSLEAGTNNQYFFLAVSKTSTATGAYWIYKILVNNNPAVFFDYPQLGMDSDAILVTANVFGTGGNIGTPYFFKKSQLYNGLGLFYWFFPQLSPNTLTPNIVLDYNPTTFELGVPVSGAAITKYGFKDTAKDPPLLAVNASIPVPAFSVPPPARQPGTAATLDTLDSRFVNSGTQFGDRIFNVHTVALGGFPAPKFYEFNSTTNTIVQSGFFFASGTSDDWNASLVANSLREVFVTYSSTDVTAGIRPQIRVSGKQAADAGIPAGTATFTSASVYTSGNPQRWGDYSSVSIDPAVVSCGANRRAWATNETVTGGTWSTRISRFGFC